MPEATLSVKYINMLTIKESQIGAVTILECAGRLDVLTGPALDAKIPDGGIVVLDMAELNYVSSAGLRSILQALKKLQLKAGSLRLSSLQPDVQRLLELSGFLSLVKSFPDKVSAAKA